MLYFFLGNRWTAMLSLIPLKILLKCPLFHGDHSTSPKPSGPWFTTAGSHPSPVSWIWRAQHLRRATSGLQKAGTGQQQTRSKGTHLEVKSSAKDLRYFLTNYTNQRIKTLSTTHQRQTSYWIKQHFIFLSTPAVYLRSV